jgi:PTH1 family peptidyl-tRNA hydrolase
MILIVGLGNPGAKYQNTRHNVGFLVVERIAGGKRFEKDSKARAEVARLEKKGEKIFLMKPQTTMNLSGNAVGEYVRRFKIKPASVWVIYDDVDLPVGTVRVRHKGRGLGRHKGVASISDVLRTHDFPRVRIGIGKQSGLGKIGDRPHDKFDLKEFVLSPFDKREQPLVEKAIVFAAEAVKKSLGQGQVTSTTLTKGL